MNTFLTVIIEFVTGYSGTPLIKKLGIKPDSRTIFINEPASIYKELGDLSKKIKPISNSKDSFDYIHFFTKSKDDLISFFSYVLGNIKKGGMLWISWPKKTSGVKTDLDENVVREIGLMNGLVDVKVVAIDDVWSGLKFVYRVKDK